MDDLLEQGGGAVDLASLDQPVHRGQHLVEGLVRAALGEVDVPELLARVLVGRVPLEQPLEDPARLLRPLRAEEGLGEAQRDLAVGRVRPPRFLEVLDRAREVLLHEVDARRGGEQLGPAGPGAKRLLDELRGLGEVALLHELVGDRHVLAGRLLLVALPGVELGEADPDLHVRGVHLGHLAQDVARLADLVALDVLVDDEPEGLLRLGHEPLAGVQVPEGHVALDHRGLVAEHLLPDRDRLQVEAVVREVPRDLHVLLVGRLQVVQLRVEVADSVDRVPVPRVLLDDLLEELDRLVEAGGALVGVRLLPRLDLVDLGHSSSAASREEPWLGAAERPAVDAAELDPAMNRRSPAPLRRPFHRPPRPGEAGRTPRPPGPGPPPASPSCGPPCPSAPAGSRAWPGAPARA